MEKEKNWRPVLWVFLILVVLLTVTGIQYKSHFYHERDAYGVHHEYLKGLVDRALVKVEKLWQQSDKSQNFVMLEGKRVNIDPRFGFPTGIGHKADEMTLVDCEYLLRQILTIPPEMVYYFEDASQAHFAVQVGDKMAGDVFDENDQLVVKDVDSCIYYNAQVIPLNETTGIPDPIPLLLSEGAEGMVYKPHQGRTFTFRPADMNEFSVYRKRSTPELERREATYSLQKRKELRELEAKSQDKE